MAVDTDYALAMSDGIAYEAVYGTGAPVDPPTALSSPWVDLGAMSTDGLSEAAGETRTSFKRWGSIVDFKSVITDQQKTFDVTFIESNPNVLGLFYKVTTPTPTGAGTSEVQTVTISGAPTGGDFVLVFGGDATTDLAFNATASAVQSALEALPGIGAGNVAVAGSAGGPYTVTFVDAVNVAALTASGASLTGGSSPSVTIATATQGGTASLVRAVKITV